jgi:hypothetical protein
VSLLAFFLSYSRAGRSPEYRTVNAMGLDFCLQLVFSAIR